MEEYRRVRSSGSRLSCRNSSSSSFDKRLDLRHHPGLNALGLGDGKHGAGKGGGESFEDPMVLVLKPEHVREVDKAEDMRGEIVKTVTKTTTKTSSKKVLS